MTYSRRGVSLVEMLIAMVVSAGIGLAMMALLTGSTRFEERAEAQRSARLVSRSAVNAVVSDLRMVDPSWGVEAATATSITVKTPYALGLICASTTTVQTIALLPVDSIAFATAGYSGLAVRSSGGTYTTYPGGTMANSSWSSTCSGGTALIDSIGPSAANQRTKVVTITMSPALTNALTVGSVVMLYRRTKFYFANSVQTGLTSRTALWRSHLDASGGAGDASELVAPFDTTASFQFYSVGSTTPSSTVPATLSDMRGLLLYLPGQSENTARTRSTPEESDLTTSVYFFNSSS